MINITIIIIRSSSSSSYIMFSHLFIYLFALRPIKELCNKTIIQVACGDQHFMALTNGTFWIFFTSLFRLNIN